MRRALFLDRDGTINYDMGYSYKISHLRIYSDIPKMIKKYKRMGYLAIVITNQSGIGRRYYTEAQMKRFNNEINKRLEKLGTGIECVLLGAPTSQKTAAIAGSRIQSS